MGSQLKGKKAVITGASSGIGKGIALRFAQEGAEVVLLARRLNRLKMIKEQIEQDGGKTHVYKTDLCEVDQIKKTCQEIHEQVGDIDILVNNAGVGYHGALEEMSLKQYERMFNLNMRALYLMSQEFLPEMKKHHDGVIINIGSIAGTMGMPNLSLYCASKYAVHGFSESLLEEVREHNIKVSVIAPGLVNTEFFGQRKASPRGDLKDYIQPEDIADVAVLCASSSQTATLKQIIVRPRRPVR